MNSYDPQKAARVWQRVQENQEPPRTENWPALVQDSLSALTAYQALARQLPKYSQPFQRLAREERSTAGCLRGVCALASDAVPPLTPPPAPRERPEILLRKCYARAMNRTRDYDSRSQTPEHGAVFRILADRERDHCRTILEILGELGK